MSELQENMEFDDLIRNKYSGYSMPAGDEFWDSISARLNEKRQVQNQKKIRTWQAISAGSIAAMVVMFFYLNTKIGKLEQSVLENEAAAVQLSGNNGTAVSSNTSANDAVLKRSTLDVPPQLEHYNGETQKTEELLNGANDFYRPEAIGMEARNTKRKNARGLQVHSTISSVNNNVAYSNANPKNKGTNTYQDNVQNESSELLVFENEEAGMEVSYNESHEVIVERSHAEEFEDQSEIASFYEDNKLESTEPNDLANKPEEPNLINAATPATHCTKNANDAEEVVALAKEETELEEQANTNATSSILHTLLKNLKDKPVQLDLYYAPGISGRYIGGNSSQLAEGVTKSELDATESGAFSHTLGFGAGIQASPNVGLKTGLVYSRNKIAVHVTDTNALLNKEGQYFAQTSMGYLPVAVNFTTTEYLTYDTIVVTVNNGSDEDDSFNNSEEEYEGESDEDELENESDDDELENNNNGENGSSGNTHTETVVVTNKHTATNLSAEDSYIQLAYISVPLEVQYRFSRRFYVNVGINAQFEIESNVVHSNAFEASTVLESSRISNFYLSTRVGLGYEQPIGKAVSVFVNPAFSTFITPVSGEGGMKTYPCTLNGNLGLRLTL